jgi:hypothetical protein
MRILMVAAVVAVLAMPGCRWLPRQGMGGLQQVADLGYRPPIVRPTHAPGQGPRVAIDEAHHNFHTSEGRYKPFAALLRRDGYRVTANRRRLSIESLRDVDVLVIANALNETNVTNWAPPIAAAFQSDEIHAVRQWVEQGGSLLLIADHAPFPAAVDQLAKAFGIEFCNCYAKAGQWKQGGAIKFALNNGLVESAMTGGRDAKDHVSSVTTFTGSAFKLPADATAVLRFGAGSTAIKIGPKPADQEKVRSFPISGWAQGAVMPVGQGRVAVFGEAAMFTAQRIGARQIGMNHPSAVQNHRLLLNVCRWLGLSNERAKSWKEYTHQGSLIVSK